MITEKEISEKAHLSESSELARTYFKELGLTYEDIQESDLHKLREMILDEIYPLLADKTYSMVRELTMDRKINSKWKKEKLVFAELFTNGSYFTKRQAVTFEENGVIRLCGWASGCNRIPFINGFTKWCYYLKNKRHTFYG